MATFIFIANLSDQCLHATPAPAPEAWLCKMQRQHQSSPSLLSRAVSIPAGHFLSSQRWFKASHNPKNHAREPSLIGTGPCSRPAGNAFNHPPPPPTPRIPTPNPSTPSLSQAPRTIPAPKTPAKEPPSQSLQNKNL